MPGERCRQQAAWRAPSALEQWHQKSRAPHLQSQNLQRTFRDFLEVTQNYIRDAPVVVLNGNCGPSHPAGPECLRQQLVFYSFGQEPSSSSPLGLLVPPPQVQRHLWPSVGMMVWGPQVDKRSGLVALDIKNKLE